MGGPGPEPTAGVRRPVLVAAAVVLGLALIAVAVVSRRDGGATSGRPQHDDGGPAVEAFFDRYVDGDGRVVRHDQGGDTVSEGQAYALLMAAARGDRSRFDRVWAWTQANLQRPDGLLSWKWQAGRVVDESPATDADLDAARALVIAGRRFDDQGLTAEGRRVAAAVLENETASAGGQLVLVAGPWAVDRRVVNPSYVSPCTYAELEGASGDPRWGRLRESGHEMAERLIEGGRLPPDWAQVDDQGRVRPTGAPGDRSGQPRYGLDAARLAPRLAEGCDARGTALAARLWARLRGLEAAGAAVAYGLDGRRLDSNEHPVGLLGAAAAARAAGEGRQADHLARRAAELDRRHPTYYGAAWVALTGTSLDGGGK